MNTAPEQHGETGDPSPVFAVAIRYVESYRFSVIPVESDKRPAIDSWEPYQHRRATLEELERWFASGGANIAVVTGAISGIAIVDIDAHHGGEETVRGIRFPRVPTTLTPHGGRHLFFRHPGTHIGTRKDVAVGVDIRGDGGYALLPPSIVEGKSYRFAPSLGLDDVPFGEPGAIPSAWLNGKRVKVARQLPEKLYDGQERWRYLLSLAGTLQSRGLGESEIIEQLAVFNRNHCRPPKPDADLRRIAAWVCGQNTVDGLAESLPPVVEPFEPAAGLTQLRAVFTKWLLLPDTSVLDVSIAAIAHHRASGEPVWPLLVSPPSGGKTEVIRALSGAPEVYELSSLTAQTLVSGMGKAKSLLPRLDAMGKSFLTLKDLTTVLTLHTDARAGVLAQLRELYDGSFRKEFGTGEGVQWEGRLGFLAGVTPAIDTHHAATSVLGERFNYLRLAQPPRKVLAARILDEQPKETEMRAELREAIARFFAGLQIGTPPALDEDTKRWLIGVGDLVSYARSAVQRDGYTREILVVPEPEANPRLLKQLAALYRALLLIGCAPAEARRIVEKVARDSAPVARIAVLDALAVAGTTLSTTELATTVALPTNTSSRIVEDLVALRLVERHIQGQGKAHLYELSQLGAEMWGESGWG